MNDAVTILRRPLRSLPDPLPIKPLAGPFDARIRPPGSKSITNRAILLGALADGESRLTHALTDAEDARAMLDAVRALGAAVSVKDDTVTIQGVAGRWRAMDGVGLNLANSGTSMRFLAASCLLADGPVTLDGDARMRERPIDQLAGALVSLGARVEFLAAPGCPPVRITPPGALPRRAQVEFDSPRSGQFISAMIHIAPFLPDGLGIRIRGEVTTPPYIRMSLALLGEQVRGIRASDTLDDILIPHAPLRAFEKAIEPDASGAAPFLCAAALQPGARVTIEGLPRGSLQGDAAFADVLARMGASVERAGDGLALTGPDRLRAIEADLAPMPDCAMALAALCAFADGPSVIRGLRTLRDKECDRIAATCEGLRAVGARCDSPDGESLRISPVPEDRRPGPVALPTFGDHRMAMAFALLALRRPGVSLRDPACIAKTYPSFFADLARLYEPARREGLSAS